MTPDRIGRPTCCFKGTPVSIFKKIFGKKVWEELADDDLDMGDSFSAAWDVPATRSLVGETVIDTIGSDDTSMPEELRGCRVVERRFSDGTTGVFYVGEGFCADETQATVLIEAHRQSVTKTPGRLVSAPAASVGGFAPAGASGPVRLSHVMNAGSGGLGAGASAGFGPAMASRSPGPSRQAVASSTTPSIPTATVAPSPAPAGWAPPKTANPPAGSQPAPIANVSRPNRPVPAAGSGAAGLDVLDELPDDETVPKALRAALVVRKPDGVYYLTKDARFVPKAEAEEWLDLWERAHSPAPRPPAPVHPVIEGPVESADQADVRFAETTPARPHARLPEGAMGSDAAAEVSPDVTPRVLEAPTQGMGGQTPGAAARMSPRMELDGRPVVKGWGFHDSGAEQDPWQRALEQAGLTENPQRDQPFGGGLA